MSETKVLGKVLRTDQGTFIVDPDDRTVTRELLLTGTYSPDELRLLRYYLKPTDNALIVGAHLGAFVVPLASACKHIIAVEANPVTFQFLEMNARLNQLANVQIACCAAYSVDGERVEFLCNHWNSGGSKVKPKFMDDAYVYDSPALAKVPTLTLDTLCKDLRVDFVHMDIEGSETHALRGAQRVLSEARILSIEFIPHHLTRVAGVTVEEWLAPIVPHFNQLYIPRLGAQMGREDFKEMLDNMMAANAHEPSIIFTKT